MDDLSNQLATALRALQSGDPALARASLDAALASDPESLQAIVLLARMDADAGDLEGAEAALRRALELDAASAESRLLLSEVLRQSGRTTEALDEARSLLDGACDPHTRLAASASAGFALEGLGKYPEAHSMFLASKPAAASLPSGVLYFANELKGFIEASRRDLDAWAVASWGAAPDYRAFATPPAFIVGFPWSGGGLLARGLAASGRFIVADDRPALTKLREHLQRHAGGIDQVPRYLGQIGEPEIRILRAMYFGEMEQALAGSDAEGKRLVDRNPINLAHLPIVRRLFPDAPIVVCLRDPRDATLSAVRRPSRQPASVNFVNLESAAAFYAMFMGLWLHLKEILCLPTLAMRFEDLLADPARTTRITAEFLGDPSAGAPPATLPELVRADASVGRWRHYRNEFGIAIEALRPFVKEFGYDPE